MKKVTVPQLPQQGVKDLELQFPDGWDVSVIDMAGYDKAPLSASDFRSALQKPFERADHPGDSQGQEPSTTSMRP